MKFSIIIPVYNMEKFLHISVTNILNQTFQDFEIILVDDGSPDNSPALCDDWAKQDSRIKVIHKVNEGVSAARNDGIRAAKGEYILFLDADDYYHHDLLQVLFPYTEQKKQVVYFSYAYVFNNNASNLTPLPEIKQPFSYSLNTEKERFNLFKKLFKEDNFSGVSVRGCYNREFLISNNLFFNTNYAISEDILFNLQLLFYLNEYIEIGFLGYYYIMQNSSCSHTNPKRGSLDLYSKMSYETFLNLKSRGFNYVVANYWAIHEMLVQASQYWCSIEKIDDAKKYLDKHIVTSNKEFYNKYTKQVLKCLKIKYNENRPQFYVRLKCYEILKKYSLDENETKLEKRLKKLKKSLGFVRNKARVLRRLRHPFKRK